MTTNYSSHKFGNDPLTEALWMITLDSGQDEEAGTVDDIGWHGLIHVPTTEWSNDVTDDAGDPMRVEIPRGTYIVYSDSTGFVGHDAYSYRSAEASEAWRKIVAAESDLYDEAEDHLYEMQLASEEGFRSLLPE